MNPIHLATKNTLHGSLDLKQEIQIQIQMQKKPRKTIMQVNLGYKDLRYKNTRL
jgi:hypothetical protein